VFDIGAGTLLNSGDADPLDFTVSSTGTLTLNVIPEPSSLVLAVFGLLGLAVAGWRRRK